MLEVREQDAVLELNSRHYLMPAALLLLVPFMLYELGPPLLSGQLDRGDIMGLGLGILLPVFFALFFIEFGYFRFARDERRFQWRWRNLLGRDLGDIELQHVVDVRRETLESSSRIGWQNLHRLIVELDDGREVGLTRGYTTIQRRRMDEVVAQVRDYLEYPGASR